MKNTPAPTVAAMESPASPTVATIPEEVVVVPAQLPKIAEEESKIKSIVIVPEVEETLDVREKIEHIESSSNNSSSSTSPVPKPVVLRKSSFMTARPFEARPVSMPIKRPNFTPMVIQPVPFVFGKIRAPEVRGFASLPPDNRSEMQSIRTTGSAGIAPFSAVNKPRPVSTVSKENPTVVIRNKLIESARRPSAELNGIPIKLEDSSDQVFCQKSTDKMCLKPFSLFSFACFLNCSWRRKLRKLKRASLSYRKHAGLRIRLAHFRCRWVAVSCWPLGQAGQSINPNQLSLKFRFSLFLLLPNRLLFPVPILRQFPEDDPCLRNLSAKLILEKSFSTPSEALPTEVP